MIVMKAFLTALIIVLATGSCQGSAIEPGAGKTRPVPAPSAGRSDGTVALRFDQTLAFAGLELRWVDVADSRCPTGENCFRAGEVTVTIEAGCPARAETKAAVLQLTLRARGEPESMVFCGYGLTLLGVEPYPKSNVTPARNDFVAEIGITGTPP